MDKGQAEEPEVVHGETEPLQGDRTLDAWAFFRGWAFYVKMSTAEIHAGHPTSPVGLTTAFNGVYHQPGEETRFHTFSRPVPASSQTAFNQAVAEAIRVEVEGLETADPSSE